MAFWSKKSDAPTKGPILVVEGLDVYYGRAHALQGVSLSIEHGVFGIVGRNGMGKTTLCNAITGLVPATGSVRLHGEELLGKSPNQITRLGIAYVPQGRRVWPSARATAVPSYPAASSRCWPSAGRCCCNPSCW
jgi:ABC-type branched-subunit amino acid transport system ATPase component